MDGRTLRSTGRTALFNFRAHPDLHAAVKADAEAKGLSIAEYLEDVLSEKLGRTPCLRGTDRRRLARRHRDQQFNTNVTTELAGTIVRLCEAHDLTKAELVERAISRYAALSSAADRLDLASSMFSANGDFTPEDILADALDNVIAERIEDAFCAQNDSDPRYARWARVRDDLLAKFYSGHKP